jgi:hypothetical protein
MNILKINNGKVELRKDNGSLIRTIGSGDAVNADICNDGSLILVTTVKGKVELHKDNGSLVRIIASGDAVNAKFSGIDIQVMTSKGKTELRRVNGSLIRII